MSFTDEQVEIAAEAIYNLYAYSVEWSDLLETLKNDYREYARTALEAVGHTTKTEWGILSGDHVLTSPSREKAEKHSAGCTASKDNGKTWFNTNPPVVSREVTEWEAIKA